MIAKYVNPVNPREYWEMHEYILPNHDNLRFVDIVHCGGGAWLHRVKNGKIIWRQDNWLQMTEECKEYFQRMLKLTPFL